MAIMNGDRLGAEGFHRTGKTRVFNQDLLISSSYNDRETVKRDNPSGSVIEPGMKLGIRLKEQKIRKRSTTNLPLP